MTDEPRPDISPVGLAALGAALRSCRELQRAFEDLQVALNWLTPEELAALDRHCIDLRRGTK